MNVLNENVISYENVIKVFAVIRMVYDIANL